VGVKSDAAADLDPIEHALIGRAKAGDLVAFEQLLQASQHAAARLAFAMLYDRFEAEDAFQDASIRAWRRIGNLRDGTRFQPWFMGIVANQCRERRRSRWWSVLRSPAPAEAASKGEESWFEGEDLRRALASLPYDQRVTVVLHFHLDMPLNDVALALGISVAGAKTRINRALKRLRSAMSPSEVAINV